MKKLITILLIFTAVTCNCQKSVLDLSTYKSISKDYYISGDTLYTGYAIIINTDIYSTVIGSKFIRYTGGRNKIIQIYGSGNFEFIGFDVSVARGGVAICAIHISDSATVIIGYCDLHHVQWGIRAFQGFNSKIIVKNTKIHDTEDDGIFAQNTNDWEIYNCHIWNVNMNYWKPNSTSGGDCIQIAYRQGTLNIHHNIFDHSSTGNKFCVIVGATNVIGGSLDFYDNILIARSNADRLAEDATTHKVSGNSCMYLKPLNDYKIYNNTFINGSNAMFQQGSNPSNLEAYNNYFQGQTETISLTNSWVNTIHNNTFTQGITRYFKGSATGDNIHHNYFSLDNFKESDIKSFFVSQPQTFEYTLVPANGYGCSDNITARKSGSFESNPCTVTIYDTVRTIIEIPTPKYYDVPRDTLIIHYEKYYKLPFSIDSVMNRLINEYENKNQKIILH